MYLKCNRRRKDGKEHRYWSIMENRRCAGGRVVQRPVVYLGEINDSQRAAWIRSIAVFDEDQSRQENLALFASERAIPDSAANAIGVRLSEFVLTHLYCPPNSASHFSKASSSFASEAGQRMPTFRHCAASAFGPKEPSVSRRKQKKGY